MQVSQTDAFDRSLLLAEPEVVAQRLLGCQLVRTIDGKQLRGRIVETEAYKQTDAASHSYRGKTPRTDVMFGPAGHLYVYFTYGMHYCCNVVVGPEGYGAAVLIRAVEPLEGQDEMLLLRHGRGEHQLTNGPAKVCQALAIDKSCNGHDLAEPPIALEFMPPLAVDKIVQTTRVGITKAIDQPWRFYIRGNPYVSKP
jgi:DNA-3-methyladenine glycosylase